VISRGIFFVPIAIKQCTISAAHSESGITFESAVASLW
jgi:hypothetical protein